jgi:flagellin
MGLRVNTNIASMTAQRNLSAVTTRLQGNFSRLSSGLRIANAADDAAGLGISERMRAQIRSYEVAGRNSQDGVSLSQTAEGALQEVSNILGRMRELSVQSANGTLTTTDRGTIDTEFQELLSEIDRIASTTTFNGLNLIDGSTSSIDIQVGVNAGDTISITLTDLTTTTLGVGGLDVSSVANANTALGAIDTAIDTVSTGRGQLGAAPEPDGLDDREHRQRAREPRRRGEPHPRRRRRDRDLRHDPQLDHATGCRLGPQPGQRAAAARPPAPAGLANAKRLVKPVAEGGGRRKAVSPPAASRSAEALSKSCDCRTAHDAPAVDRPAKLPAFPTCPGNARSSRGLRAVSRAASKPSAAHRSSSSLCRRRPQGPRRMQ